MIGHEAVHVSDEIFKPSMVAKMRVVINGRTKDAETALERTRLDDRPLDYKGKQLVPLLARRLKSCSWTHRPRPN